MPLADDVRDLASAPGFSGVVRVDRPGEPPVVVTAGLAHRALGVPVTPETRFGTASGTKGLTALTVLSLVADGVLSLGTRVRSLLREDLPLVDDAVTVEHLLAHTSGIGDYLDEELLDDVNAYVMPVPAHVLDSTAAYLAVLDGHPQVAAPGSGFRYCNSGFVVLALVAERATGQRFEDLVAARVCRPAGMTSTAFLRSDELPGTAAVGYLTADGPRTNVHHLPVVGSGDGGAYTTAADVAALWRAVLAGRVVPQPQVELATTPRSDVPAEGLRYGLGFWLSAEGRGVQLLGSDAGVTFRTVHDPGPGTTWTVLGNVSAAGWAVERGLAELLGG